MKTVKQLETLIENNRAILISMKNRKEKNKKKASKVRKNLKVYIECRNYLETNPTEKTIQNRLMDVLKQINIHTKRVKDYAESNAPIGSISMLESVAKNEYFKLIGMNNLRHQQKVMEFILTDAIPEL